MVTPRYGMFDFAFISELSSTVFASETFKTRFFEISKYWKFSGLIYGGRRSALAAGSHVSEISTNDFENTKRDL